MISYGSSVSRYRGPEGGRCPPGMRRKVKGGLCYPVKVKPLKQIMRAPKQVVKAVTSQVKLMGEKYREQRHERKTNLMHSLKLWFQLNPLRSTFAPLPVKSRYRIARR